mmetsp:Transcript_19708/g.29612  ORF Transcript_19708/g.29612 Transcript_19708/m.29612 type:complete len:116 (+) Transcript_19708:375-722(+)
MCYYHHNYPLQNALDHPFQCVPFEDVQQVPIPAVPANHPSSHYSDAHHFHPKQEKKEPSWQTYCHSLPVFIQEELAEFVHLPNDEINQLWQVLKQTSLLLPLTDRCLIAVERMAG